MKKISNIFILALAIAGTFTMGSCKKDKTRTEILQSQAWQFSAIGLDLNGDAVIDFDVYAATPVCSLDDFMTFNAAGQMITDEGASLCNVGDPQTTTDHYSLNAAETQLTLMTAADTTTYTITSFSDTEVKANGAYAAGGTVYLTFIPN